MLPLPKNDFASPSKRYCTQSKCRAIIPEGHPNKSCEKCLASSRISMQKKRKRDKADEGLSRAPAVASRNDHLDQESRTVPTCKVSRMTSVIKRTLTKQTFQTSTPVKFEDENAMMTHLKKVFKKSDRVFFFACYDSPVDPLTSDKDLINATAHEIWRITGYRFK